MPDSTFADPEVQLLATISASLEKEQRQKTDMWAGSPFRWIRYLPSPTERGAVGEELVRRWCRERGIEVSGTSDSEADLVVADLRIEVKYSSLWTDRHIYRFQQIRDQHYDYCFCLGVSPRDVHAWFVPKAELMVDKPPELVPQHTGQAGSDTRWLSFPAESPPHWLTPYGGTLGQVRSLIESAARQRS